MMRPKKQISIMVDHGQWELLRHLAAIRRTSLSQLILREINWPRLQKALQTAACEQSDAD